MTVDDATLSRDLAALAGRLLVQARDGLFARHATTDALKDEADALAQAAIAEVLGRERPDDAVLSEEAWDDRTRLQADRVWIIDPLDGTREYARAGRVDWAVHVALWERRVDALTVGAVGLPAQGLMLESATVAAPAWPSRQVGEPLTVVVSQSRRPKVLEVMAERIPLRVTTWGSAGAKAAQVIRGEVDAYVHDSALNEWDAAAPVVVAQAAGLHVSALDGGMLRFNREDTVSGSLLMCRPDAAAEILSALASSGPGHST
jgi:3'(2'), 5'-bisphosphate nucleotidase